MPFDVAILVFQCPTTDLKDSHCHPWTNLCQLDAIVPGPHKDVMSYLDTVLDIFKGDYSVADLVFASNRLPRWEKVFQDLHNSLAQTCRETVKDQVRVRFADRPANASGDIVTQYNVVKRK